MDGRNYEGQPKLLDLQLCLIKQTEKLGHQDKNKLMQFISTKVTTLWDVQQCK